MLHYVSLRFTQKRIHQLLSTKTKSLEIAVELLPQNSTSKSPFYRSKIGVKRSKKVSKKPVVVATCWFLHFWCPGPDLNRYGLFIRGILSRRPFCFILFQSVSFLGVFEKKSACHVSTCFKVFQIPPTIFEKFSRKVSRKTFSNKRLFIVAS
jgi:hypothetical protein